MWWIVFKNWFKQSLNILTFSNNWNHFFQIDSFAFSMGTSSNAFSFVIRYFCVLRSWLEACCKMSEKGGEEMSEGLHRILCMLPVLYRTCEKCVKAEVQGPHCRSKLPSQKPWHDSESPHSICRPYSSTFYPLQLCKAFTGKQETTHGSFGFRFPYKFKNEVHCDLLKFANLFNHQFYDLNIWILDLLILILPFWLVWS